MPETYGEQMKQRLMYERQSGDAIRAMLEQNSTNTRVNSDLAKVCAIFDDITSRWRGKWKNLMGDYTTILQRNYMALDGYARVQAIEIAQSSSITGEALSEKKKRGGLIGWLSGE